MLPEFITALSVSLFLAGVLFWLLIRRLRLNRNKANTFAPFYLLPVVLAVLIAAVAVLLVFPRIKDIPHILADNYEVVETTIETAMLTPNGIVVNDRQYHLAARLMPKAGTRVRLYVTPFSDYIMRVDALDAGATEKEP